MLIGGTSWQTASQMIPLVLNLALTPWVIHGLGPERYSVYLLAMALIAVMGNFDGGIGQSALRFFTLYAGRDDREKTTRLLVTAAVGVGVLAFAAVVLTLLLTPTLLDYFKVSEGLRGEATTLLFIMVPVIGMVQVRNLFSSVVYARQRFRLMSIAIIVAYFVYIVGLVLTVVFGWGLVGIAWTLVAQQVANTALSLPVGVSYLTRKGMGFVSKAEALEYLGYAWKIQVTGLTTMVTAQKDQLFAGRLLSAQESGPYGQGTNFSSNLKYLPHNAIGPIQALIGHRVGESGAESAVGLVERIQRFWVRATTGWCAVGAPATYFGVRAWLPDSYADAATVATILLLGHLFWLISIVLVVWTKTIGHPEIEMRAVVIGLVANLAMSFAFAPVFGMTGVVVATALSNAVVMGVVSWGARRSIDIRPRWFMREVPWISGIVAALVCLASEWLLSPYFVDGAVGLLMAAASALPAVLVFAFSAFSREERKAALGSVRARLRR